MDVPFRYKSPCLIVEEAMERFEDHIHSVEGNEQDYAHHYADGIQDVRQISAVGLDIYGADVDAIMKAAENSLEGMVQSL